MTARPCSSSSFVTRPLPQPASRTVSPRLQVGAGEDLARPRLLRIGDLVVGRRVPGAAHASAVVTGPGALAVALEGRDRVRLLVERHADVVQAVEQPVLDLGSISNDAEPPSQRTSCAARSTWAWPASAIASTSSAASSTASRPFFEQLLRKMSAKLRAMIAWKP
jgi:hypothetical protein